MSLPNTMTIGAGPYEQECPENEYRRSLIEIVDDMDITPAEAEKRAGEMKFSIHGYTIAFNFHYDEDEETFVVNITECEHGYFNVFNFEVDELRDLIEEKLDLLCHIPERISLSEARKRYFNLNK
jgi:hypothetical protein